MLPATNVCKLHHRRLQTATNSSSTQSPGPAYHAVARHDGAGQSVCGAVRGSGVTPCSSNHLPRASHVKAAAQLLGPALPFPSTSAASAEALRPRRFSAPVIARLLRSTTTIQDLADVVQQQSPYFDVAHVGIALLHLALLASRQQRQQPAGAAAPADSAAGSSGTRPRSSSRNGTASAASTSAASTNGRAGASGSAQQRDDILALSDGDGLLSMSSITDGDDEDDVVEGGGDAARSAEDDAAGDAGSHGTEAQPSVLLDAATAALRPAALDADGAEEGPSRVVAVDQLGAVEEGGATAAGSGSTSQAASTAAATAAAAPAAATPAALNGGPSSSVSPASSTLRTLLPLVFSRLDSMSGSDLANVVSSLAVLRYGDKVVVEQLLQALSLKLYECRPQDLSNVMCSAALLGVPPDPDLRTSFYSAARAQVRRFGPRELALTMWAYGAVGTDVQEDAVQLLLEASRPKLAAFSPLQLAKMAQGLAALKYRPTPEWVDAYCEALRASLRRTASRELCALLLALASLQVGLDDTTRATLLVHTLTQLPSLAPSELALSIWALGRLTAHGLPALIDLDMSGRVLDLTLATLGSFTAGELQQLLEGLTRLALQPPLEWMQAYVAALQPKLGELDARQLAGVLGSLAAQQYRPRPEMQEVVLAATEANMQQLLADTTCTASLITALRRLNIEPPPGWVGALLAASRSALKNRCSDLHLANLAGSLAAWGVRPDGRWAARLMWRSQVLMTEGRMSPRALVALLQAMSSLGLQPNETWTRLCLRAAAARASQPSFEPHHFSTLMASLHALGVKPPQEWMTRMLLSTYRCWDRFGVTHWSSLLPALVLLEARPPREWLRRLEATTAARLPDCSALQLLTLVVSLCQLHQLQAAGAAAASAAVLTTHHHHHHHKHAARKPTAALTPTTTAATAPNDPPYPSDGPSLEPAAAAPQAAAAVAASGVAALTNGTAASAQPLPAASLGSAARPGASWLAAWWSASTRLLGRVRYAPSELVLTAGWLVSLGLRPPAEWLQACADVAQRYSKVMAAEERQQLAAAVLPLVPAAGRPAAQPGTQR